ncbi:type I restriction/modification system, S subunit [Campylobacter lari]|uniref:type I restriction/modification system, S subunit n=1 Tax=Campylobacter lari TaxID=201 RepID=UPI000581C7F6|nr:type I restriction/modification system, S subunit [Campylobacter lari]AJD06662.1 type I restriction/modification system, S subunit [Campylobacter lari RM16712]MCR6542002.1 type I restriction/modification system, S subunit [Campylobacter lari]
MKNDLANVEWKEFKIGEIFHISGTITTHPSELMVGGKTPRITCAATNNGLDSVYKNLPTEKGGVLSIDSATIGFVAYQENDFIATDHVETISLQNGIFMNRYIGLFIKQCIDNAVYGKYGYGYKFSQTRIKKQIVMLPVDSKSNPNWQFMENYMKNIEQKYIKDILAYYNKKLLDNRGGGITTCSNHSDRNKSAFIEDGLMKIAQERLNLENIKWKEFIIGEIFEVKATLSGIDKNKLNGKKGTYPYITRSDKINGIDSFIAKQDVYHYNESNVITIGLDTQTAFYQSDKFYTGQNIQILTYKELNKYNALFIIILLKKLMEKFSWGGNGATLTRLKRGKIILPIDSKGSPDYKFMETYMQAIKKEYLEKITSYYNAKLTQVDNSESDICSYRYKDFVKQNKS